MIAIDDMKLSVFAPCDDCTHYRGSHKCKAFPQGIPSDILDGSNDHRSEYPGDNGIKWEKSLD